MRYLIKERNFKRLGFSFEKLHAANYRAYRKVVDGFHILCWVKGKEIQVDGTHGFVNEVFNFFKANINSPYVQGREGNEAFMCLLINTKTGDIVHKKELKERFKPDWDALFDSKYYASGDYKETYLPIEAFRKVVECVEVISSVDE